MMIIMLPPLPLGVKDGLYLCLGVFTFYNKSMCFRNITKHLSCIKGNLASEVQTRSYTKRTVQPQVMVRGLKSQIKDEEGLYSRAADLCLCFHICKK